MPKKKDSNQTAAKQVAEATKTKLPKGESLLGDQQLRNAFAAAKSALKDK
jgi:hypothetical protein